MHKYIYLKKTEITSNCWVHTHLNDTQSPQSMERATFKIAGFHPEHRCTKINIVLPVYVWNKISK